MYKLTPVNLIPLTSSNQDMYYIYFNTYFIDKYQNHYEMIDDFVYNLDYENIVDGEEGKIEEVFKSNVISQLPLHYQLESNVLIKFNITSKINLVYRGIINLEKFNNALSLHDINKIMEIKDIYYESEENCFLNESSIINKLRYVNPNKI